MWYSFFWHEPKLVFSFAPFFAFGHVRVISSSEFRIIIIICCILAINSVLSRYGDSDLLRNFWFKFARARGPIPERWRTFPTVAILTCGYYPEKIAWRPYGGILSADSVLRIIQRSQRALHSTLRATKRNPSLPNSKKSPSRFTSDSFSLPLTRARARAPAGCHFVDCRVVFPRRSLVTLTFNARDAGELDETPF